MVGCEDYYSSWIIFTFVFPQKNSFFFFFIFLFFPSSFRTKWMERFLKFCLYSWRVVHREEWGDPLREETLFKNHLCLRLNIITLASTVCTPTRYCFKSAMGQWQRFVYRICTWDASERVERYLKLCRFCICFVSMR